MILRRYSIKINKAGTIEKSIGMIGKERDLDRGKKIESKSTRNMICTIGTMMTEGGIDESLG